MRLFLQNRTVAILAEGDYSPEALIAEYVAETHASNKLTWLLRLVTVLLIWFWLFITAITCNTNQVCLSKRCSRFSTTWSTGDSLASGLESGPMLVYYPGARLSASATHDLS